MKFYEYEALIKKLTEIRLLMDEDIVKAKQKLTILIDILWGELREISEEGED